MVERDEGGKFRAPTPFEKNKSEIIYNLINSALAGGMVFVGTIADGKVTPGEMMASLGAAGVIALIKFKEYWAGEKGEYTSNLFSWI